MYIIKVAQVPKNFLELMVESIFSQLILMAFGGKTSENLSLEMLKLSFRLTHQGYLQIMSCVMRGSD